jgi:glycosyltransferase involved in cell wall biosynthesis
VQVGVGVHLPKGWQDAIASRARFILDASGRNTRDGQNWFDLVREVSMHDNGAFFACLAITGCYPDKFELRDFADQVTLHGLPQAVQNALTNRSEVAETARNLVSVELVSPKFEHLVDVTHTYFAPYLTGIQRVVFEVTSGPKNISTFIWVGDSGIIQEKDIRKIESTEKSIRDLGWRIRLVHFLHAQVPKLDKSRIGTRLRILSLPLARTIKRSLVAREVDKQVANSTDNKWTNVLILNTTITIPEIPASLRHIYIYESILENEIVSVQVILYDFIPFFHAWTVHFGNRGHLNSYIRLVLLATRIISISSLVQEQAKLITQAFKLERSEWSKRKQIFEYMALPSGLKPATSGEFRKQENLVVMAGSLEPRKNHMQFLSAVELLVKDGVRIKARILGSAGWDNEHILEKIHDLQGKGIDIERLGNLTDSDMRKLIAEAQVLLQISEAEGFGLPIAEALALGTKVIASDIRPLNEWDHPRVSHVQIGDFEQLKVEISKVLNNPEKEGVISVEGITWQVWHRLLFGEKSTF